MKPRLTAFLLMFVFYGISQERTEGISSNFIFTPEFLAGYSAPSNENFPDRNTQLQLILNFGWDQKSNTQEWVQRLKGPRTGISLGYTDLGNTEELGAGITVMPFIEMNAFRKEFYKIQVGMGATYFTEIFDPVINPRNMAVSTELMWSFRAFFHYKFLRSKKIDWRLGLGYYHHSNGHTRLPNQGFNSFLVSLSADIKSAEMPAPASTNLEDSRYKVISMRAGYGFNVLSLADPFNDKLPVYTVAGTYGKVYNKTWKLSAGFYYRFYQHYYDYIRNNESLVQDGKEFESYKEDPWFNASVFGLSFGAEVLLNHVGLDLELGWNLFKPAYKIDYRINEGWDNPPRVIPDNWVLGEYDTKFRLKHAIASRMGLKYYLIGTDQVPKHNIYVGAHINANLGQADFTDFSLGYVYNFNFRDR